MAIGTKEPIALLLQRSIVWNGLSNAPLLGGFQNVIDCDKIISTRWFMLP